MKRRVIAWATAATLSASGVASAKSSGMTGLSGQSGVTCTSGCHDGTGPKPTVALDGPAALDAGAIAEYTFTVTTTSKVTGMNASVSDGLLASVEDGLTQSQYGEVMQILPDTPTSGKTTYRFQLHAPEYGGTITLYAAGNACNGNHSPTGDNTATTSLDVAIDGPPRPPSPPDAGSSTPPSSRFTPPAPVADAGASANAKPAPAALDYARPDETEGCASGSASRVPGAASLLAIAGLVLFRRARRRR